MPKKNPDPEIFNLDALIVTSNTELCREQVSLLRNDLANVILMDINLPDISGIEALKILCSDATKLHTPVIALSANAMPQGIQKGLIYYITKPIKINEFMEALGEVLYFAGIKPEENE
jgi:CheY-like chemotaxis protein